MRETYFATVGLVIALLSHSHQARAQGTLDFVTLFSATSLPRVDDTFSSYISTDGAFPFGRGYVYSVSVSENGYILMGEPRCSETQISITYCHVVAPYGADSNIEVAGTVRYTDFDTYSPFWSSMTTVSSFIRDQTGDNFYGSRMMVAEWNGVAQYSVISPDTNTFQAILITNGSKSYAVFIYECGGMNWGGGEIGWRANSSQHVSHSLSGLSNSDDIGCLYSNTYSAIVYRLYSPCDFDEFTCDDGKCTSQSNVCDRYDDCEDYSDEIGCGYLCTSNQFTCDNGRCTYNNYKCDGYDDCGDNSDEEGCGVNLGLALGLSFGLLFLTLLIVVPLCIAMGVYSSSRRTNRPVRTRAVTTNPCEGATTVVTSSQASTAAPTAYSLQPVHKDTQLSSQDAPPSYTDVIAFSQAYQGYNQYQPNSAAAYPQEQNTMYPPQNQAYPPAVPYSNQAYPPPNSPYPTT